MLLRLTDSKFPCEVEKLILLPMPVHINFVKDKSQILFLSLLSTLVGFFFPLFLCLWFNRAPTLSPAGCWPQCLSSHGTGRMGFYSLCQHLFLPWQQTNTPRRTPLCWCTTTPSRRDAALTDTSWMCLQRW